MGRLYSCGTRNVQKKERGCVVEQVKGYLRQIVVGQNPVLKARRKKESAIQPSNLPKAIVRIAHISPIQLASKKKKKSRGCLENDVGETKSENGSVCAKTTNMQALNEAGSVHER